MSAHRFIQRVCWTLQNPIAATQLLKSKLRINEASRGDMASRVSSFTRRDDIALLLKPGGIGIELGVAAGGFSEKIMQRSSLGFLYGVDMWADGGHNINEYKAALHRIAPYRGRSCLLKMRFDEALDIFPDASFDFIYVDGYAHTGEEGGQTFYDWWPKLKSGGIFAGDDYSSDWPLVVVAVDRFVTEKKLKKYIIRQSTPTDDGYSKQPTWFVVKP